MLISNQSMNICKKNNNTYIIPQKSIQFTSTKLNKFMNMDYNKLNELRRNFYMNIDNANKEEIAELLKKKAASLPLTIDSMFYNIGMYFKKDIDNKEFVKRYCELTDPLYRRIVDGPEKEDFNKNYAPEIDTLVKIRQFINEYNEKTIQKEDLDSNIDTLVRTYLKTPIKREKFFAK